MDMETWKCRHEHIDMRLGNTEKWRHGDSDMETWTWRYGHRDRI